jgi:hypothetical protein
MRAVPGLASSLASLCSSAKKPKPRRKPVRNPFPDLPAILYRFSEARCVLACVARSLEELEDPHTPEIAARGPGDEVVCLRYGLKLLSAVHDESVEPMAPGTGMMYPRR